MSHYNIYKSIDDSLHFEYIAKVIHPDTVYVDNDLVDNHKYYYYITAVDSSDLVSEPSDTVSDVYEDDEPLPIGLSSFDAVLDGTIVNVRWVVEDISNIYFFELRRFVGRNETANRFWVDGFSYFFVDSLCGVSGNVLYELYAQEISGEYTKIASDSVFVKLVSSGLIFFDNKLIIRMIGKHNIVLYNMLGQRVFHKIIGDFEVVNLDFLASGVYIVVLVDKDIVLRRRIWIIN